MSSEETDKDWYTEDVTIKISKRFYAGEPSGWEVEVTDHNGEWAGEGTAPTFAGAYDIAWQCITGDHGDYHDVHNEWVDFDANKRS